MSATITQPAAVSVTIDDKQYQQSLVNLATVEIVAEVSVPAAKVGAVSAKTDADTGTVAMTTGHGFSTSDKIDLFWDGGSRHGMTATVTGDSVALDGGSGTDFPAAPTPVTAMKPTQVPFVVTGDNVVSLGAFCPVSGYVSFRAGTTDTAACQILPNLGGGKAWALGQTFGGTNPLAGASITNVQFSHNDSTQAQTMRAAAGY